MLVCAFGCNKSRDSAAATAPTAAQAQAAAMSSAASPISAPPATTTYEKRTILTMSTRLDLMVPTGEGVQGASDAVKAAFDQVAARANEWRETSPLSAVNAAAGGQPVAVPPDLRSLLKRGLHWGRKTDGAFDVTWAALWGVWDFKASEPKPPPADEIARRLALIDWQAVQIDDKAGTVRLKNAGMKLGLGGIAKGWALDRSAEALKALGAQSFMMSAGGQVRVAGGRSGRPWRVGIRDPRGPAWDYFAVIELTDGNVSTSGDYERFFEYQGVRYHHILDPRTGQPARGLRSATVIAATGTDADALSTALMAMGREKAMALVTADPALEAVLVDSQGTVHASPGMGDRLRILHPPKP